MELPANLDLHRVVLVQVGLSTLAAASVSPTYNLPIHLYGLYHVENDLNNVPGASEGLRHYCILLVATFVLDLLWMYNWASSTTALPFILILVGLIVKPVSLLTCLNQLNRTGNGFGVLGPPQAPRQAPFQGLNSFSVGGGIHRETPAWAASSSPQQFRASPAAPPPGPSSVSHQATAAHEFALDGHADAQNLSDEEVLRAKKELDFRIAQKKQQLQQQQSQLAPQSSSESAPSPAKPVDGSGYHTLE